MASPELDATPGFRRRFLVTPLPDRVTAAVEDDIHCMAVTLDHDGTRVTQVEAVMDRWPWTTCPGAIEVLAATFTGATLAEAAAVGRKQANCTHLFDLAMLAAAHAGDPQSLCYDILVSDPIDGSVSAEIRCAGTTVLRIEHRSDIIVAPDDLAGVSLFKMRPWIEAQSAPRREAARLLQWGAILAHGRTIPLAAQSDASLIPPNCFTFQPEHRSEAQRIGRIVDFSASKAEPLGHFDGHNFGPAATP